MTDEQANRNLIDSKDVSEHPLCFSIGISGTNLTDLMIGQFVTITPSACLSTFARCPTLGQTVNDVVPLCTKEQMAWSDTGSDIAMVKHLNSLGDRSKRQFIGSAVG